MQKVIIIRTYNFAKLLTYIFLRKLQQLDMYTIIKQYWCTRWTNTKHPMEINLSVKLLITKWWIYSLKIN